MTGILRNVRIMSWDHLKFVSWQCWPNLWFGILRGTLEGSMGCFPFLWVETTEIVSWQFWPNVWFGILRRTSKVWAKVFHSCELRPAVICELAMLRKVMCLFLPDLWLWHLAQRQNYELRSSELCELAMLAKFRFGILQGTLEVWANGFHSCELRPVETCELPKQSKLSIFILARFMTLVSYETSEVWIVHSCELRLSKICELGMLNKFMVWYFTNNHARQKYELIIFIFVIWDKLKLISWQCWPNLV